MHSEDAVNGWNMRNVNLLVKVPEGHGFSVNGQFEPLKSIVCDSCGKDIPNGTKAVATTMWRDGQEIGTWEPVYGEVVT